MQVVEKILLHMDNAYNIPNLRGRGAACRTNLPSNTAFRGFGVPQSVMVVENMLEDVAAALGRPAHQVLLLLLQNWKAKSLHKPAIHPFWED